MNRFQWISTPKKNGYNVLLVFAIEKILGLAHAKYYSEFGKVFFFEAILQSKKFKKNALKIVLNTVWSRSIDPKRWLFEIENAEEAVRKKGPIWRSKNCCFSKATVWKRWENCISDLFSSFPKRMLAGKENYREFLQTKAKSYYKKNV